VYGHDDTPLIIRDSTRSALQTADVTVVEGSIREFWNIIRGARTLGRAPLATALAVAKLGHVSLLLI
jgi:hypothetical protein